MRKPKHSYRDFLDTFMTFRHLPDRIREDFLRFVVATVRRRTFGTKDELWRSQLGFAGHRQYHTYDENGDPDGMEVEPIPLPARLMKPLTDRAKEGRANAKGQPVLYLSSDPDTCIAEQRPWMNALVTVARFRLKRRVTLVDCTADSSTGRKALFRIPEWTTTEGAIWESINNAFRQPVGRQDDIAEYLPTQVLAEAFRQQKFDGILFSSSLGDGKNVVLFNPDATSCGPRYVYQVTNIKIKAFKDSGPFARRKKMRKRT